MIGQYLSRTNESAIVPKRQKFCQLNKALEAEQKICQILCNFTHNKDKNIMNTNRDR
jgi:hypothetical protein